ncbi:MAG TPA: 3-phosphoshikimate 1-carboxyvinyltransferase [Planctomycetaceae bacterium]|nr:3-phosphoshikimate 1-carboxyvinyltransferase [Planctomycetaceae bacterium]
MHDVLEVLPVSGPVHGTIRPPGSKSITNRALVIAALARGDSRLTGVLDSQDTRVMLDSLQRLGLGLHHDPAASTVTIAGCAGAPPATSAGLWLENSGTSIRFLTALCCLGQGEYRLDGNTRMRERPLGDLIDALNQLGAHTRCELDNRCPPVVVSAQGLPGGLARVASGISSQYLSALLMAAPGAQQQVTLEVAGELVSEPYVDMTIGVMQAFGVEVGRARPGVYAIAPQTYCGTAYDIEPDASAASYFFALAAVTGGRVTVQGLSPNALQGDVKFADVLARMGCRVDAGAEGITVTGGPLRGIEVDMNAISDTAQTLAAVAPFATGPTTIRNIAHVRHKETDRIAAVATELRRLGQQVDEFPDGLTIHPAPLTPATVATYDDHRMAMSFSLVGLRTPGVKIADPGCTRKTYPHYFDDLARLCGHPGFPRS